MLKLYAFVAVLLYGIGCFYTMPSQCFTLKYAVTCQKVQAGSLFGWHTVDWDFVDSIRVIK